MAGSGILWLQDSMKMFSHVSEIEELLTRVTDDCKEVTKSEGVYFVPALNSSLLAPYWRNDAKGTIVGLTSRTEKCHIIRYVTLKDSKKMIQNHKFSSIVVNFDRNVYN